jgi:hypothetical protein
MKDPFADSRGAIKALAEAEAREQRQLHDAYDKHEIHHVMPFKLLRMAPDKRGIPCSLEETKFGQCACGRAFIWVYPRSKWVMPRPGLVKLYTRIYTENAHEIRRLFKYADEVKDGV